ncbi:hypothetical protein LUZ60_014461 [Juncus effusus]|nr:hypothetical protein LUZ60_014461 [Juncus effusus]
MGQDVILERSKSKSRQKEREKPDRKNYLQLKSTDGEEFELAFPPNLDKSKIPNFHCKSMPCRPRNPKLENDSTSKRGSVYQTSDEVRQLREISKEGRRKLDLKLRKEEGFISFDLGSSNLEPIEESEPVKESKPERNTDSDEFLELSFRDLRAKDPKPDLSRRDSCLLKNETEEDILEIPLLNEAAQMCSESDHDPVSILSKSFSTKFGSFDHGSSKPHSSSSPFKRMLNPLKRSKSMKHSPLSESETLKRNGLSRKSLLNEFSKATNNKTEENLVVQSDGQDQISDAILSPAHLRATLKLDSKNGCPNFEFSVKDPVEILSAKTWKTENKLNWVYTFHGTSTKRVSIKEKTVSGNPIIGQMQVSCYLCSEKCEKGNLRNSAETEFILYDINQARRRNSNAIAEERISCNSDSPLIPTPCNYPWSQSELYTQLETAAIVVRTPFEQMERKETERGMKGKGMEGERERERGERERRGMEGKEGERGREVRVVVPVGQHGESEEGSPAGLLERWRYGGGCDCGGWDMGCPINVFGNGNGCEEEFGKNQHFSLFLEGSKEKLPAISIVPDGEGQYLVDFHAQLSSLQAFAMCVSLLHCSETAPPMGEEKNKNKLYSSSLKLILEEEVRHLIEAVSSEEKMKIVNINNNKMVEQISQSFVVDHPPFSPMGRV